MAKDKDNRVVHSETRKNSSLGSFFEGSRSAKVTLGDGRTGRGTGSSDSSAKSNAIRNARSK